MDCSRCVIFFLLELAQRPFPHVHIAVTTAVLLGVFIGDNVSQQRGAFLSKTVVKSKAGQSPFHLDVEPGFDFLSSEYKQLFESAEATAFQSPQWLSNFYNILPSRLGADPLIVTIRANSTGNLLLVLPLIRQQAMMAKILQPADLGVSDYNAVIAAPETLPMFAKDDDVQAALEAALLPYDILLFRKQRDDSFDLRNLLPSIQRSGRTNTAYAIDIEEDFETWVRSCMSGKHLSTMRRKQRGFERDFGELTFENLTADDDIKRAFIFLKEQRAERFPEDLLSIEPYFEFYQNYALATASSGESVIHVGLANGNIASVEFGPVHQGCFNMLLAAFNHNEYAKYSVGILSMLDLIADRVRRGEKCVDFTIGEHEYKQRFKARSTQLHTLALTNSPLGTLAKLAYSQDGQIKRLLKIVNPRLH